MQFPGNSVSHITMNLDSIDQYSLLQNYIRGYFIAIDNLSPLIRNIAKSLDSTLKSNIWFPMPFPSFIASK